METVKKTLLIFMGLILIVASGFGGFYAIKKYFIKETNTLDQPKASTTPTVTGLKRDIYNKVPKEFPKGLISEEDVDSILESFIVTDSSERKQYTVRYISKKNVAENQKYFETYAANTPGFSLTTDFLTNSTTFLSMGMRNKKTEIDITINLNQQYGYIVDVTMLQ